MLFYALDPAGTLELKVFKNEEGDEIYIEPDDPDPEGYSFFGTEKASIAKETYEKLQVSRLRNLPEFDIHTFESFNDNNLRFLNEGKLKINQQRVTVTEKKTLFVQPARYNISTKGFSRERKFHLFEISETDVKTEGSDGNVIQAMESPTYKSTFTESSIASVSLGDYRVVLRAEDGWFDSRSGYALNDTAKELLKFERYRVTDPAAMGDYLISVPIKDMMESLQVEDITFLLNNDTLKCLSKVFIVSLLKISKANVFDVSYNFNNRFIGWNLIVFPFICFIEGLSIISHLCLYARIVHLSQSSGYGKTRLCFEHLRKLKRGIYCVYRGEGDKGYPKTTPWMEGLINAFRASRSDEDSVKLCLSFIHWSITNFSELEDVHFKYFEHSAEIPKDLEFKYADDVTAKTIIDDPRAKEGLFTIVIDECQELLIKPKDNVNLISLYRAFRRAMNLIKETPIVAVFLGTKSSLGDFVLSGQKLFSGREEVPKKVAIIDVPVYIFTHSCNSMLNRPHRVTYDTVATTKLVAGIKVPRSIVLREIAWCCGRPLWKHYSDFEKAFSVAEAKLLEDDNLCDLTCLVMRTGSKVVAQDPLAHRLVLSGLATLLYVDSEGSRCIIEYVPEPIVSNAARIRLTHLDYLRKSLKEYVKRLQLGVFHETGVAGEQVGRIVLLRIMDLLCLYPQVSMQVGSYTNDDLKMCRFIKPPSLTGVNDANISKTLAERLQTIRQQAIFTAASPKTSPKLVSESTPEPKEGEEGQSKEVGDESEEEPSDKEGYEREEEQSEEEGDESEEEQSKEVGDESEEEPSDEEGQDGKEVEEGQDGEEATVKNPVPVAFDTFLTPALALNTVRQFLLLASNGRFDDELWKLGVSDEVLNGVISFSQFSNMENVEGPLLIDQVFLMNAFARGCALTLPDRIPGADLIIPVLRTDSMMSCIAVQIKNLAVTKFPYADATVSGKLSSRDMPFINLKAVGDFKNDVHADDFVRIAVQFGPKDTVEQSKKMYSWTRIAGSKSQATIPEAMRRGRNLRKGTPSCNVLWLRGLNALEHCFFGDKVVMEYLDIILSAQRDIFSNLDYPRVPLPTTIQTTEEGARFLNKMARPLAQYANIVTCDSQARTKKPSESAKSSYWDHLKTQMKVLQLPRDSLEHFKMCKISPEVDEKVSETVEEIAPECDLDAEPILAEIRLGNRSHSAFAATDANASQPVVPSLETLPSEYKPVSYFEESFDEYKAHVMALEDLEMQSTNVGSKAAAKSEPVDTRSSKRIKIEKRK